MCAKPETNQRDAIMSNAIKCSREIPQSWGYVSQLDTARASDNATESLVRASLTALDRDHPWRRTYLLRQWQSVAGPAAATCVASMVHALR
jgi:hypothetical protein